MATYNTQIQWDVERDKWRDAPPLVLVIERPDQRKWGHRQDVVPENGIPLTGTKVSWFSPKSNGSITFHNEGHFFDGWHQSPGGWRAAYRGQLYEG